MTRKINMRGARRASRHDEADRAPRESAGGRFLAPDVRGEIVIAGKPFVLVPADAPRAPTDEDAADRALLASAAAESAGHDMIPGAVADRLFAGENAIKAFREWRGLIQADLATAAGITQAYLSEIESGKPASAPTYRRLAALLRVALELIMPEESLEIWKLTPRMLDDDDWRLSTWKKSVIVRAPSEKAARWAASFEFSIAAERRAGQRTPVNPWRQVDHVAAERIDEDTWTREGPIEILYPEHHNDEVAAFDWSKLL